MRKLWYLGLEPYPSRYTWQLREWNRTVFERRGIDVEYIDGDQLDTSTQIVTGSVLDAHGRCYYSATQIAQFVKLLQQGAVTSEDAVLIDDMFTPGIESLGYVFDQTPAQYRPKVYVRSWAQSPDPDDFINRTGMAPWMRHYEHMVDHLVDGVFVANEELVALCRVAGWRAPIHVVGLPFEAEEVRSRAPRLKPLWQRSRRVVFASRWDDEKQPNFYMDLAEHYAGVDPTVQFVVCTGRSQLDSNNPKLAERALSLHHDPAVNFEILSGLSKEQYYATVADSVILFNCALQDWVSFTGIEADTLGTMTVYPAYRSFPETFNNNHHHLYVPWSTQSAAQRVHTVFDCVAAQRTDQFDIGALSSYQSGTIDRMLDAMTGSDQWLRSADDLGYRRHVAEVKS